MTTTEKWGTSPAARERQEARDKARTEIDASRVFCHCGQPVVAVTTANGKSVTITVPQQDDDLRDLLVVDGELHFAGASLRPLHRHALADDAKPAEDHPELAVFTVTERVTWRDVYHRAMGTCKACDAVDVPLTNSPLAATIDETGPTICIFCRREQLATIDSDFEALARLRAEIRSRYPRHPNLGGTDVPDGPPYDGPLTRGQKRVPLVSPYDRPPE